MPPTFVFLLADPVGAVSSVVSLVLSGAVIAAAFNIGYSAWKDRSVYRKQKLEEIHRAIFFLTWGIQPLLHGLQKEFGRRDALLTTKEGYVIAQRDQSSHEIIQLPADPKDFSEEKLSDCCERIRELQKSFPVEKVFIELETFIRLSSVYFKELVDERDALADYVRLAMHLVDFLPSDAARTYYGNETRTAQRLAWESDKIRLRVAPQIWAIAARPPWPFGLLWKRNSSRSWTAPIEPTDGP